MRSGRQRSSSIAAAADMAVVLSSEDNGLFSSSTLRRSHSQPKFMSKQTTNFHSTTSTSRISDSYDDSYHQPYQKLPASRSSSAPSSPRTIHADSVDPSYSSTPATNLSLDGQCEDDLESDDRIILPPYDENPFYEPLEEDLEPPTSPRTGDSYTVSPADQEQETSATPSRPETPELFERAEDDTAVRHHPTQHVDYLSHNWKEEDIWSSWRYIISRRGDYSNSARLENASWRTWMKSKYKLKTVSPETLNWLKDCDVTWLYGPLQTRQIKLCCQNGSDQNSLTLSRNVSFINKKPILKKRSMSEIMLQRSLSTSSLLKQATAAVQAQQKDGMTRPILSRATTDSLTFRFPTSRLSRENTSLQPSTATSGFVSPSVERKHIHFDEQVKQCIAVEIKGDDGDDDVDHSRWNYDDSDSDTDAIMIKTNPKKKPLRIGRKPKPAINNESKTIAMLPSTTLKYRSDTPEPQETAMKHSTGATLRSPSLSPSPSQETLRPSRPSGRFFFGEEEDDDDLDEETSTTPVSSPIDATFQSKQSSLPRSSSVSSLASDHPPGMRRTESGMFMPVEEGSEEVRNHEGIFGRVIDTVNTARDIAHVIWNVGWRK